MKIVLINKSAGGGGAAVACYRLFQAIKCTGTDVNMLVEQNNIRSQQDVTTVFPSTNKSKKALTKFIAERLYFLPHEKDSSIRFQFSPAIAGVDISNHPLVREADIIHLHWINQGFLSLKNLEQLFKLNKPIVWTMHDMWPFTGGCHYSGECNHFIDNCGSCPFLKKPHNQDLSFKTLEKKSNLWDLSNLYPVACSHWLKSTAQESSLFRKKKISCIPNPIDTDIFIRQDQSGCRKKLNLPEDKKLLLFGAANINDSRKGVKYLIEALNNLKENDNNLTSEIELVIFGKTKGLDIRNFPNKVHLFNFIEDIAQMVCLYNAADAFILPSLQDNLPNTVMESLSCGVPVIAFNIGGVPEMISHHKNGYLADARNSKNLAKGISETLFHPSMEQLKETARNTVLNNYSNDIISQQYLNLYQNICHKS